MPRTAGPLTISMFLGSFAWSFAFISLPFYIQSISPYDSAATLRWSGWILGISSLVTVVTSPAWGRVGERGHGTYEQIMGLIAAGVEANVTDRPGGIFVRAADQISSPRTGFCSKRFPPYPH